MLMQTEYEEMSGFPVISLQSASSCFCRSSSVLPSTNARVTPDTPSSSTSAAVVVGDRAVHAHAQRSGELAAALHFDVELFGHVAIEVQDARRTADDDH